MTLYLVGIIFGLHVNKTSATGSDAVCPVRAGREGDIHSAFVALPHAVALRNGCRSVNCCSGFCSCLSLVCLLALYIRSRWSREQLWKHFQANIQKSGSTCHLPCRHIACCHETTWRELCEHLKDSARHACTLRFSFVTCSARTAYQKAWFVPPLLWWQKWDVLNEQTSQPVKPFLCSL